ncbi:MAG: glycosyltransferase family 2 protein [Planctomycetota bacterium]
MTDNVDLTIFVPAYNEENLIVPTLETIRDAASAFGFTYQVLVYNDASTDRTGERVGDYLREHHLEGQFELVNNEVNRGVGMNYLSAAERGRGEYFIMLCGDNAEPVDAMRSIFNLMGKADVIIPYVDTRLFDLRYNTDHRPFMRRLISLAFASLVRTISGHSIRYFNSCVLHKRANVLNYATPTSGYGYQAELLCEVLNDPKKTYLEVKFANRDRAEGKAKAFRLKNIVSVAGSLGRIFRRRLARYRRPA